MAKARDKVQDAADSVKPYVDRALRDDELRKEVLSAFATAKDLYKDLSKSKTRGSAATKVALDDDVRDRLRDTVEDMQKAVARLQGRKPKGRGRRKGLMVAALALGILFNPLTGPEARKWVTDLVGGEEHDHEHPSGSSNGSPA